MRLLSRSDLSEIINSYSHAPQLHSHPIVASLQLLAWLFFHPVAWCNHIARLDPTLPPDFCLIQLNKSQWQNPGLRHLLLMGYLIPGLTGIVSALALYELKLVGVGILFGVAAGLVLGLLFGLTLNLASGIVSGMVAQIAFGMAFSRPDLLFIDVVMGVAIGIIFGLVNGVTGHVADNITRQPFIYSLSRQVGGVILGLILSGVVMTIAVGLVLGFTISLGGNFSNAALVGIGSGAGQIMLFAVIIGRRIRRWGRGAFLGLLFGGANGLILYILFYWLYSRQLGGWPIILALCLTSLILFSALFILPYVLSQQTAGPLAGTLAGAISSVAGHVAMWTVISFYDPWLNALVGLSLAILGLTMRWWRPLVVYPFQRLWGSLLRYFDRRCPQAAPSWLGWHPAFWDELQWLRWPGLDHYLVWITERNPAEGQRAIDCLATGYQRWAAQAAQIELEVRKLEQCATVEAISQIHLKLITSDLTGPVNGLLHTFGRTSQDVQAALNQVTPPHQRLAFRAIELRLMDLQQEFADSPNKYANRFYPVVIHWGRIIADYSHQLVRTAESQQEVTNVYFFSIPLTQQHHPFVGRTQLAAHLEQRLLEPAASPVLLYGQRRMGKTSFLYHLEHLLPANIVPLFVDGEKISGASNYLDFLYNMGQEMIKSARSLNLALPPLTYSELASAPTHRFEQWLDTVEQYLETTSHRIILLAIDELDALDTVLNKGRFLQADILNLLHHLSQRQPHFKLLLAASQPIEKFYTWMTHLTPTSPVKISYLEKDEAYRLIEQPVSDFSLKYEAEASQKVLELTRGHPHLIQLLCHEIVNLKNEQEPRMRRLACPADVEAAVPRALNRGSFFFMDIEYKQLDSTGRRILYWLAAQGKSAVVRPEELACSIGGPDQLDRTLQWLNQRDLIELKEGGYRFQVELIQRWFAREKQ